MQKSVLLLTLIMVLAVFATGCAKAPTPEELAKANYGTYPGDYQEVIKRHMNLVLKDPASAQYNFYKGPSQAWYSPSPLVGGDGSTKFGYAVCVGVNAKNSFGGYTGMKPSYFLVRNGSVIARLIGDSEFVAGVVNNLCSSF